MKPKSPAPVASKAKKLTLNQRVGRAWKRHNVEDAQESESWFHRGYYEGWVAQQRIGRKSLALVHGRGKK